MHSTYTTQMEVLEEEAHSYKKIQEQKQLQRFKRNKFVGLKNTGNLCYLNSTMQVIFNLPLMCDAVIKFFEQMNPQDLNETAKEFLRILKQKKEINEKDEDDVENVQLDMSKLRKAFNYDLEKRHRDKDNTFGYGQNDSSEFYILLFEFLIKFRKDQDLKRKNAMLGVGHFSDNPPSIIERLICKKNFNFGKNQSKLEEYFINETLYEDQLLEEQVTKMENSLKNTQNPIEKYFFNGFLMTNLGPCKNCNYYSLSVHDFAFFELNFPQERYGWSTYSLTDLIKPYFKQERVNSRCKNPKCELYPIRIMKNKNQRTLYFPTVKNSFLIKLPQMLKIMFKKYEGGMKSGGWYGSRIGNKVEIPVLLQGKELAPFYYKTGCLKIDKKKDELLATLATDSQKYNYYLFAYSTQSGSLDSGHYVSHSLQYYEEDNQIYFYYHLLNDSYVDKPVLGGKVTQKIECDAYWAMYVREDQEDFKNQLINNKCPAKAKKGFSFL